MKLSFHWTGKTWYWIGLSLLCLTLVWWFLLGMVISAKPGYTVYILQFALLTSVFPLVFGVYGMLKGRRLLSAERRQSIGMIEDGEQDKIRDVVCKGLLKLGLDARLSRRGRVEEKTGEGSLGLIILADETLAWANVRKVNVPGGDVSYRTDFGVPDPSLRHGSPDVKVRSVYKKTFPIFGRVSDVQWEGEDCGTGIVGRLNADNLVNGAILAGNGITICSHGRYGCWTISTDTLSTPSPELWSCYQRIAQYLLGRVH